MAEVEHDVAVVGGGMVGANNFYCMDRNHHAGIGSSNGWSYETVLRNLTEQNDAGNHHHHHANNHVAAAALPPPRMDVSALIEAKRKTLLMTTTGASQKANDGVENRFHGSGRPDHL